ncbi:MAG: hypothetical protein P8016_00160 [Sedimentisphaerales bacterium]
MNWTIKINEEDQYVEVVTSGDADKDGTLNMIKDMVRALSPRQIKKILIDHSNIDSVSGEALDIYDRPKEFKKIGVIPGIKVAEVVKPEHMEFFYFVETIYRNRGYQLTIFPDHASALEWLLE